MHPTTMYNAERQRMREHKRKRERNEHIKLGPSLGDKGMGGEEK